MINDISRQDLCTGGKAFPIASHSHSKKGICENSNNSSPHIAQNIQVQNAQVDLHSKQAPLPPEVVSSQDTGKQGRLNHLIINGLTERGGSHCRTNAGMEISGPHNQHTSLKENCLPGKQVNILQAAESAPKQAVPLFENRVSEGIKDFRQPNADKEPSSLPGNNQHTAPREVAPREEHFPVEQISILQDAEGAPEQAVSLFENRVSEGVKDTKQPNADKDKEPSSLPSDNRNISLNNDSLPLEQVSISQVAEGTSEQVVPVPQLSVPFSYLPLFSILSICPSQHYAADDDSIDAMTFKAFTTLIILMNITEGVVEVYRTGKYITFGCKQDGPDFTIGHLGPDFASGHFGPDFVSGHLHSISMADVLSACPFMHSGICSNSPCRCQPPVFVGSWSWSKRGT